MPPKMRGRDPDTELERSIRRISKTKVDVVVEHRRAAPEGEDAPVVREGVEAVMVTLDDLEGRVQRHPVQEVGAPAGTTACTDAHLAAREEQAIDEVAVRRWRPTPAPERHPRLACRALVVLGLLFGACNAPTSATATVSPNSAIPTAGATGVPATATLGPASGAISLEPIASGFEAPLDVVDARDQPGRLYVVEQGGLIRVIEQGSIRSTPFLDLADSITSGGERGLLGLAFAPDYATSGRLFVDYTDLNGDTVVERFERNADGSAADPSSGTVILTIKQPASNHNGGDLLFGPDGMLWIGTGDGGAGALGNGQRTDTLLGKMLRIDVSGNAYTVPPDNPFVGTAGVSPEIWATGLRNPWRYTVDRSNGDLWIGDVGQGRWEEVDVQPGSSHGGENYGWARMEGPDCSGGPCDPTGFVLPVTTYGHGSGDCAIVGGYVYRGGRYPSLAGTYLYGDTCSGRIWGIDAAAAVARTASPTLLLDADMSLSSFGEDRDGELYVTDLSGGGVYHVVGAP